MKISNEYAVMIFRNDNDFGTFYKVGLVKKDTDGKYINGYKDCRFRKGVEIEDKTKIYIKKAWIDFYIKDNKTIDYIFISEYETLKDTIEKSKSNNHQVEKQSNNKEKLSDEPFIEFGKQITIDDSELPF